MARSISNAKLISSFVADQISVASRRGYAVTSTGNASGSLRGSGVAMMKKGGEESNVSNSWVPDAVSLIGEILVIHLFVLVCHCY